MSGVVRHGLFSAWYRLASRKSVFDRVAVLQRSHRLERHELDGLVRAALVRLLRHAVTHVPYYRRCAEDQAIHVDEDHIESSLVQFPILTKDILRAQYRRLCAENPGRRTYENTSGGSTGVPVRFLQDRAYQNWALANKLVFNSWTGYTPGDTHVKLWGAPRDIFDRPDGLFRRLRAYALNETVLNCYRTSEDTWRTYIGIINQRKPVIIEAYADAICEFSRYLGATQTPIHLPRGIITSAGVLLPQMKAEIERAFGCPVLNRYGSREVSDIACSCPGGDSLHVSELTHYVEVLDACGHPCGAGEEGDVYITLLTNYCMPLIRYRIEDRAVYSKGTCHCGRTSRLLHSVTGRTVDYLVATDGTRVNGTALTTLLYGAPGVKQYQLRQTQRDCIELSIIPTNDVDSASVRANLKPFLGKLATVLGMDMRIDLHLTDVIALTPTGKRRYIINEWTNGEWLGAT